MFKKFLKNTAGNFSLMMAGSFLMLMGGIGLTVDYLGMTENSASLQAAADGAALAAALASGESEEDIKRSAEELFEPIRAKGYSITTDYVITESTITVKAQTVYKPRIMGALGFGARNLSVLAEVPIGGGGALDISLVLDVTDSMDENNKLEQMQDAVNAFLNQYNTGDGDVRVSIVPFSQYVNVGLDNINASWLDNSREGTHFPPYVRNDVTRSCPTGFVQRACTRTRDGSRRASTCRVCEVDTVNVELPAETISPLRDWDGCVGSRPGNLATQAAFNGVRFPAVYDDGDAFRTPYRETDYACPPDAILPLTNNISSVQTMVSNLNVSGNTYMPSGLVWGWRTLNDNVPLGQPIAGGARKKVLILMTDGFNTISRRAADPDIENDGRYHHGEHDDDDAENAAVTAESNAETGTLCSNIAAENIQIFTIGYELPSNADANTTRDLLRSCAGGDDGFFDANNATALNSAFDAISKSLSDIRLIN